MAKIRWVSLLFIFLAQTVAAKMYIVGTAVGAGVPATESPRLIDLGDGSDGEFNTSTYANFGTVSSGLIILNTDTKSVYNFTNFILASGYVIQPIGSRPLIIKSLQDVIIAANAGIRCSGYAGADTNMVTNTAGGEGRCGGARGGNGTIGATGSTGSSGGPNTTGGAGGRNHASDPGGGGGGGGYSYQFTATASDGFTMGALDAAAGDEFSTDLLMKTTLGYGGSGGGGGGAYTTADNNEGSGGAGGGGGGVVEIFARRNVTLEANTSFITVMGGDGGEGGNGVARVPGPGLGLAGGGGGGGGGTIFIVAGEQVSSQAYGGPSIPESGFNADGGAGGSNTQNWAGGSGARGRIWIVDKDCDDDVANSCGDDTSIYLPIDVENIGLWPNSEYGNSVFVEASELEFQSACGRVGSSWRDGLFLIFLLWLVAYLPFYAKRWRYINSKA